MQSLNTNAGKAPLGSGMLFRRVIILGMLLSLHAALITPTGSDYERIWLLVHFGLFLLWQPFISAERELKLFSIAVLGSIVGLVLYTLAGWMLVGWVALLIGIIGGKVFTVSATQRSWFYLVAVFYLFAMLLIWTVPVSLLHIVNLPDGLRLLATTLLPLVLASLLFLPYRGEDESGAQIFDFFYSLLIFQLVVVLVLGSIASMRVTDNQYFQAVLLTILVFAGALLCLAALWGPRGGFGGLNTYFSRYLMTVGMPFEIWMRRVAELSETEGAPSRFLDRVVDEVAHLTWVAGCHWRTAEGQGQLGKETAHATAFHFHGLEIVFFSNIQLSPALFLHLRLLAQVIGEFYEGKRREQALKQNAYMQAVHETGARLTHDIKNLLQSLLTLTASAPPPENEASAYTRLLSRQLPELSKRLQSTLEKLQNPEISKHMPLISAEIWWQKAQKNHEESEIQFVSSGDLVNPVPEPLFDTVLDNTLDNALKKKSREPRITIRVLLEGGINPALTITDTGSPISTLATSELFKAPVASSRHGGLGIGLFQAHRQAEQAGYELMLISNEPGKVAFRLQLRLQRHEPRNQPQPA